MAPIARTSRDGKYEVVDTDSDTALRRITRHSDEGEIYILYYSGYEIKIRVTRDQFTSWEIESVIRFPEHLEERKNEVFDLIKEYFSILVKYHSKKVAEVIQSIHIFLTIHSKHRKHICHTLSKTQY